MVDKSYPIESSNSTFIWKVFFRIMVNAIWISMRLSAEWNNELVEEREASGESR